MKFTTGVNLYILKKILRALHVTKTIINVVEPRGLCLLPVLKSDILSASAEMNYDHQKLQSLKLNSTLETLDISVSQTSINALSNLQTQSQSHAFTIVNTLLKEPIIISQADTAELIKLAPNSSTKYYIFSPKKSAHLNFAFENGEKSEACSLDMEGETTISINGNTLFIDVQSTCFSTTVKIYGPISFSNNSSLTVNNLPPGKTVTDLLIPNQLEIFDKKIKLIPAQIADQELPIGISILAVKPFTNRIQVIYSDKFQIHNNLTSTLSIFIGNELIELQPDSSHVHSKSGNDTLKISAGDGKFQKVSLHAFRAFDSSGEEPPSSVKKSDLDNQENYTENQTSWLTEKMSSTRLLIQRAMYSPFLKISFCSWTSIKNDLSVAVTLCLGDLQIEILPNETINPKFFASAFQLKIGKYYSNAMSLRTDDGPNWAQKRYSDTLAIYENSVNHIVFNHFRVCLKTEINKWSGTLEIYITSSVNIENLTERNFSVSMVTLPAPNSREMTLLAYQKQPYIYTPLPKKLAKVNVGSGFSKVHKFQSLCEKESEKSQEFLAVIIENFYIPIGQLSSEIADTKSFFQPKRIPIMIPTDTRIESYIILVSYSIHGDATITISQNFSPSFYIYNELNYEIAITELLPDTLPFEKFHIDHQNLPILTLTPGMSKVPFELLSIAWPYFDEELASRAFIRIRTASESWSEKFSLVHEEIQNIENVVVKSEWFDGAYHLHFTDKMGIEASLQNERVDSDFTIDNSDITIKSLSIVLFNTEPTFYQEILRTSVTNLKFKIDEKDDADTNIFHPTKLYSAKLEIGSFQVDNQMYHEEEDFDFPVVVKSLQNKFLVVTIISSKTGDLISTNIEIGKLQTFFEDKLIQRMISLIKVSKSTADSDQKTGRQVAVMTPQRLKSFSISKIDLLLSARTSTIIDIRCDNSPLSLNELVISLPMGSINDWALKFMQHYQKESILSLHWILSGVEFVMSPISVLQGAEKGLSNFYQNPGLSGATSFFSYMLGGSFRSISNFTGFLARNLDRLSLDDEHITRVEAIRRQRPSKLSHGIAQGAATLGLSLLGAFAGVVQMPMQAVMDDQAERSKILRLAGGVSKGLIGLATKPLAGTAQFISQTGRGLTEHVGINQPKRKDDNPKLRMAIKWSLSYPWYENKFGQKYGCTLTMVKAHVFDKSIVLVLTEKALILEEVVFELDGIKLVKDASIGSFTSVSLYQGSDQLLVLKLNTVDAIDILQLYNFTQNK